MKGAVRMLAGLILTMAAVGGMEDPSQADFLVHQVMISIAGLGIMFAGVNAASKSL